MDDLAKKIIDGLREEAIEVGSELIEDGVDLLQEHMEGRASDEAIMAWLRRAQGEAS